MKEKSWLGRTARSSLGSVYFPNFEIPSEVLDHATAIECGALGDSLVIEIGEAGELDSGDEELRVSSEGQIETLDAYHEARAFEECPLKTPQGTRTVEEFAAACGHCTFATIVHGT